MTTITDEPFRADVDEVLARYGLDDPGHAMLASDLSDAFDEAVRDAAAEVERLRAVAEQDAHAIDDAIDAMVAHDHGERDGDCSILFTSEIDKLRDALAAVPAPPQADDRLAWAEAGAQEMQDKAESAAYAERIFAISARDKIYNRACLDCARKIRELDASIVAQEVIARRAVSEQEKP